MNLNIVSKYRNEIYGISILWILLFHGSGIDSVDYTFGFRVLHPVQSFISAGNVGVDMFLFLSGICLYFSFAKNNDIYAFAKKRVLRILPPVLLIYGAYWLIRYAIINGNIIDFISRIMLLRFWLTGDQAVYFASLILVMYFIYPYIHAFLFSGNNSELRLLTLLLITYGSIAVVYCVAPKWYSMTEIALTRIPVFILGCYFGKIVYEGKAVSSTFAVAAILVSLVFLAVLELDILHGMLRRFFYLIGGVGFTYTFAILVQFIDRRRTAGRSGLLRALSFVGGFSFELYLAQIMVNQILRLSPIYIEGSFCQYLAVMIISMCIAYVSNVVTSAVCKKILDK